MEALHLHGPNSVRFHLEPGGHLWDVFGCYLAPHRSSTLEHVAEAIFQSPHGMDILFTREFNVDMAEPDGQERNATIAAETATKGLEDMAAHFLPCRQHCTRDGRTWSIPHCGQEVRSHMEYILGT